MANAIEQFNTPKGTLEWVTITGEGKENLSGKLKYCADLVIDPKNVPEHQAVIDKIDAFWAENKPKGFKKKAKSLGYYLHDVVKDADGEPEYDEDGNKVFDKEGKVKLSFSTDTTFAKSGDPKVIKTYNSKAKIVALGEKKIGNGSVGIISGAMGIYTNVNNGKVLDAGVTLYLNAIQIHKLVEFTGSDDPGFAADDSEDGFEAVDENGFTGDEDEPEKAKPRL